MKKDPCINADQSQMQEPVTHHRKGAGQADYTPPLPRNQLKLIERENNMKQVTNMSRLVNQLEKMFRALNADFFGNTLDMPVITVTPSARSYAHYTPWDAWSCKEEQKREINIASGTLNRPLEAITASLLHEMVHMMNDTILNVQDTSRNGTYHNKHFAAACADHGLICEKTDRYGWAKTRADDRLLDWLLTHDELREIEMCRINPGFSSAGVGAHSSDGGLPIISTGRSNSRRWVCPGCGMIARTTRAANLICGDCMENLTER